jgi:hypothetical protein
VWRSVPDEVMKGATLIGEPKIDHGLELNGVDQAMAYALNGQFATADPWSCDLIFWPDFEPDDDSTHYIIDTVPTNAYALRKLNTNTLQIRIGGVLIKSIPLLDYQAAWKTNERNVLSVSSTSADSDALLNREKIMDADVSAWTPTDPTELIVGRSGAAASYAGGIFEMLKIYNARRTDQEHINLCDAVGV